MDGAEDCSLFPGIPGKETLVDTPYIDLAELKNLIGLYGKLCELLKW